MITFTYIGHSTSEESRTFDVKSTIPNEWRTAKSENFIPMNICLKYSGGSAYGDTPFIASYNEKTGIVTFPKCANYGSASGWKYYLEYDVYFVR